MNVEKSLEGRLQIISTLQSTKNVALLKKFVQLNGLQILNQWLDESKKLSDCSQLKSILMVSNWF